MSKSLEDYISFLPKEGQYAIDTAREESQEPLSVLSAIHWVAHHEGVEATLGQLLIHEVNTILKRLGNSNNSTLTAKSAAALSLTPDKCLDICFGDWEDYGEIQKATQTLERFLGRKVYLRPNPEKWPVKKSLVTRLHEDSKYRRSHIKKG